MADALGVLDDWRTDLEALPSVMDARVSEQGAHAVALQVRLSEYNADTWDRIVSTVDGLARDFVSDTSIDLEISVSETP